MQAARKSDYCTVRVLRRASWLVQWTEIRTQDAVTITENY